MEFIVENGILEDRNDACPINLLVSVGPCGIYAGVQACAANVCGVNASGGIDACGAYSCAVDA